MADAIRRADASPIVQRTAAAIASTLPADADAADAAHAVHGFVRRRVRFVDDSEIVADCFPGEPVSSEVLIEPAALLTAPDPVGDCDDFTMLAAALLRRLGVDCEIVTVAADPQQPDRWSHVYLQAIVDGGARLAVDASHGLSAGWEAPHIYRKQVWPLTPPASTLHGLGQLTLPGASTMPALSTWGDVARQGVQTAFGIVSTRLAQPSRGTYIQTAADGSSLYYRQQDGGSAFAFPTTQIGGAVGGNLLLYGVLIIGAIVLMGARR